MDGDKIGKTDYHSSSVQQVLLKMFEKLAFTQPDKDLEGNFFLSISNYGLENFTFCYYVLAKN